MRIGVEVPLHIPCASGHFFEIVERMGDVLTDLEARARELSGNAYERSRRVRGDERLETLVCAVNHAFSLRAEKGEESGAALLHQATTALRERYGPEHPVLIAAQRGVRAESDLEHWDT